MISQFFVLSPRGDPIISRDFRGDMVKGTAEIFFRKVKFWTGDPPPIFCLDGINYIFIKRNQLYFVTTTHYNVPPSFVLGLLHRITRVFKDFCGLLTEEVLRKNFVLIYEVLDEMVDFGYPQLTHTEELKKCVANEAAPLDLPATTAGSNTRAVVGISALAAHSKTVPSAASHRPLVSASLRMDGRGGMEGRAKEEIFVDIIERLSVVISAKGADPDHVLHSAVEGTIQMKSFLTDSPLLKLALNDDISIGSNNQVQTHHASSYGKVHLDDCNFHECADLSEFEHSRSLIFRPPDGEFSLINYRVTTDFRIPFRVHPHVMQIAPNKLELVVKIRADIPENNNAGNVVVTVPVTKAVTAVTSTTLPAQLQQV
eukprot:GHVT01082687.1.p1 GENE.GHVT01082687.1~~GHVT01082687.1.p1  ORF type:complete len:371 (+),score=56.16 GHVT01082687.1:481-1593(+)